MSKPEEIPQDVWEAVEKATRNFPDDFLLSPGKWAKLDEVFAHVIMAERERCADLLKDPVAVRLNWLRGGINADSIIATERERCAKACDQFDAPVSDSDFVNGQATAAQQIRAAIRKGGAP